MKRKVMCIATSLIFWSIGSLAQDQITEAMNTQKTEYLKTFQSLQAIPEQAIPIQPCSADETRWFLQLMASNHIVNDLFYPAMVKVQPDGSFVDGYDDHYVLFKGNFNNTGTAQYLLLGTGAQTMTNSVIGVWQVSGTSMTSLNFDGNVVNGVIGNGDISSFYLHVAKPFAYIYNGKTYLRFVQGPDGDDPQSPNRYDLSQLAVCTYLWQGQSFSLVGPSNCIGGRK